VRILAADGIANEDEIKTYKSSYDEIFFGVKADLSDEPDIYDKHERLFDLLHDEYLVKYKYDSFISKLFNDKEYNCITAVILYSMICNDLGLDISLYETPYHVYIVAHSPQKKNFIIELTDPVDGFDMEQDNRDYIEYLVDYKLVTPEELESKGESGIYNEFITETHLINSNSLAAAYFSNSSIFNMLNGKTYESYKLMRQALEIAPDSGRCDVYDLVWQLHTDKIKTDEDSLSSFLLEAIDSIPSTEEFRKSMLNSSGVCIDMNVQNNHFEMADSIYNRLYSVLPGEMRTGDKMSQLDIYIETYKIRSKQIRGGNEEAFVLVSELYANHKDNESVLDMYLYVGNQYMQSLGMSGEAYKMLEIADSMFINAPGIKSVEDSYVNACIGAAVHTGLYRTNFEASKKILFDANERLSGNPKIKNTIGYIFHDRAMAEIRNRNYKEAIKLLNEGLQYDPDNFELKHEIEMTNDLLK
jgi:tetratricopeptide (TPR) repeat protein